MWWFFLLGVFGCGFRILGRGCLDLLLNILVEFLFLGFGPVLKNWIMIWLVDWLLVLIIIWVLAWLGYGSARGCTINWICQSLKWDLLFVVFWFWLHSYDEISCDRIKAAFIVSYFLIVILTGDMSIYGSVC